jgi:hypothetical protein
MVLDRKEQILAQKRKRLKAFFDSFVPFCNNSEYYKQIIDKIMRSERPEKYIYIEDMDFSDSVELKINKALKGLRLDANYAKIDAKVDGFELKGIDLEEKNFDAKINNFISKTNNFESEDETFDIKTKDFDAKDTKLIKTYKLKSNFTLKCEPMAHKLLNRYLKEYVIEYKEKEPPVSLKGCVDKVFETFFTEMDYLFIYSFMNCDENEKMILINNDIMDNIINCLYHGERERKLFFKTHLEQEFDEPYRLLVNNGDLKGNNITFHNLIEIQNFFDGIFSNNMLVFSSLVNNNFVEELFNYFDISINYWGKIE